MAAVLSGCAGRLLIEGAMLSDTDQREFVTASCEGKPSFPSFGLASSAAKRGRARRHLNATPYRCKWCGLWHVGTRMKGRKG